MKRLLVIDPRPTERDHILRRWRELGYHITGVTPVRGASGLQYCHERVLHPFFPLADLITLLRKMPVFDGVVCYHQAAIHVANQVAHALGLPAMWENPELDLSNKRVIQSIWESARLRVPKRYRSLLEIDHYPAIVKPAGLQGQIGVKLCRSKDDAQSWIKLLETTQVPFAVDGVEYEMTEMYFSDRTPLIQEQIISDPGLPFECSAEFLIVNGKVKYLGGFDKTSVDDPDLPNEELLIFPHVIERKVDIAELLPYVESTGYQNGFCHLEYKISEGCIVPIELNARLIGSPGDQCLSAITSIDCADLMARVAIGAPVDIEALPDFGEQREIEQWSGFVMVHLPRRYTNRLVKGYRVPSFDGVTLNCHLLLKQGEEAVLWESCVGAPIGLIRFEISSRSSALEFMEKIGNSFSFDF